MGHVWLGFGADQVRRLLRPRDSNDAHRPAAANAVAKGPALFVASAEDRRRSSRAQSGIQWIGRGVNGSTVRAEAALIADS